MQTPGLLIRRSLAESRAWQAASFYHREERGTVGRDADGESEGTQKAERHIKGIDH